jgi:hypothetical protein
MLTAHRARLLCLGFAGLSFAFVAAWVWHLTGHDGPVGPDWKPQAVDFTAFWSAARLAVTGHARALYDNQFIGAFERSHTNMPAPPAYFAFYYPPPFLLLCLPLALLPYLGAMLLFLAAQAALLWSILRRILGTVWGLLPVLCWPGFLVDIVFGQNGGFSAACFGGALLLLHSRPMLAGVCLGALVCKPQLALCVPIALLAARRARALAACAATALALSLLSLLAFGPGAWAGFLANAPAARNDIETLPVKWPVMQSVYASARLAGCGLGTAYILHAIAAAAAIVLLIRICLRRSRGGAEMAALAATALLFSPFLYIYDLTVLAVPLAWVAADAARTGWWPGEKLFLLAVYILPPVAYAAGLGLHAVIGPPFVLALLLLIERRAAA